jgi:hypothetical protein
MDPISKRHIQIMKDIQTSSNPIKTAIDHGCSVGIRKPTILERLRGILPLDIELPAIIESVDIKVSFEWAEPTADSIIEDFKRGVGRDKQ